MKRAAPYRRSLNDMCRPAFLITEDGDLLCLRSSLRSRNSLPLRDHRSQGLRYLILKDIALIFDDLVYHFEF
jgi:hypothetical protein